MPDRLDIQLLDVPTLTFTGYQERLECSLRSWSNSLSSICGYMEVGLDEILSACVCICTLTRTIKCRVRINEAVPGDACCACSMTDTKLNLISETIF